MSHRYDSLTGFYCYSSAWLHMCHAFFNFFHRLVLHFVERIRSFSLISFLLRLSRWLKSSLIVTHSLCHKSHGWKTVASTCSQQTNRFELRGYGSLRLLRVHFFLLLNCCCCELKAATISGLRLPSTEEEEGKWIIVGVCCSLVKCVRVCVVRKSLCRISIFRFCIVRI